MRFIRSPLNIIPIAVIAAATCAVPTDMSRSVYVVVSSPTPVLLRGDETALSARVWTKETSGDSVELRNVALLWYSSDSRIATVAADGRGTGLVTGVNSGPVEIRAVAAGYESASSGVFRLRVSNPLEIDSVTPDTVRYGERLTMYGVGVGDLFFAGLGPGFLMSDSLSIAGDASGLSQQSFWVPYPSRTGHIFAAGSGQLVSAPDSTVVRPYDLYEPNENSPTLVDLGATPFPAVPAVKFFNPALAFEDLRDFPFGFDWYRLRAPDPATPHTIVFSAPALAGAHSTYLTDRLRPAGANDPTEWRVGSGSYMCKGADFRAEEAPSDSVMVALRRLPPQMDLMSAYLQEGRYLLAIVEGYVTADPRVGPDRFEENDICDFADDNFANSATRIDLKTAFGENLTIDNPHDVDWFRFQVPGLVPQPVAIRTASSPMTGVDRSDIDFYVFTVPSQPLALDEVGRDVSRGSAGAANLLLAPGDYYLAVTDSAGVPTRYSLCMAVGSTCTLPAAPPPLASSASGAAAPPRLAPYFADRRRTTVRPAQR